MLKAKEKEEIRCYDQDYWSRRADEIKRQQKQKEYEEFEAELQREIEQEKLEQEQLEELPEEYYKYDWCDTPKTEPAWKILTRDDFFSMEWRETQYHIYRLLYNISSFLSDIKEVLSDGTKK